LLRKKIPVTGSFPSMPGASGFVICFGSDLRSTWNFYFYCQNISGVWSCRSCIWSKKIPQLSL